jgi:glutamate formiminotransferase / formiminotetrahydrofolate cyclodeaminase
MSQLIECIPNFSEARRPEVVDKIISAIGSVEGARLLDRSSDLDHNRTVLTLAGSPAAVEEASFRAIREAAALIDLNHHTGQHPRIGATDVVPFVPLADVSMEECVLLARRLGERVGSELKIPIYLYEYAATRPERKNLENLRKGQFEGLREEIRSNPDRKPDFGPVKLGTAGATVIGARDPLIAFNVYLGTSDVEIARKIATAIRHSSGGLRFVKALGLFVEERAQVSINLTNFHRSPVGRVVEMIRSEAVRYGTTIHHCEVVGLIPQAALVDAAVWYTQLDQFSPDQILESRLYETGLMGGASARLAGTDTLLKRLAEPTATPGGGSAGAYAGALGAALAEMVAGLTIGKSKYREVEPEMMSVRLEAQKLRQALVQAVEDDAVAFEEVMAAWRLPGDSEGDVRIRDEAIQRATLGATRVPLLTARSALHVMELASQCAQDGNINTVCDAMSGAVLAHAALEAAGYNVRVNLKGLKDASTAEEIRREISELEAQASRIAEGLQQAVRERAEIV